MNCDLKNIYQIIFAELYYLKANYINSVRVSNLNP